MSWKPLGLVKREGGLQECTNRVQGILTETTMMLFRCASISGT